MMQSWFPQAKLGIFIHWGIYAVNGIPESWSFYNRQISYEDYMAQLDGFTASNYDPQAWADLFKRSGAQYAVLTTKHHDGVALWDTQQNDLSVVKKTPAGRDLIGPYADALREQGIKVGFYFSHLDWSHPDYSAVPAENRHPDTEKPDGNWTLAPDSPEWQHFLKFHRGQLQELCTQFGKVDLLWFDGDWTPGDEHWNMAELRDLLHSWQPEVILNSRMHGHGDYKTPEQGIPIARPEGPWEFCVTINDSWGYQVQDHNHKSVRQIIRMFCEVIGMGGNLLLDIGPKEDGTILPEQVQRLEGLGNWIRKHEEAVYSTGAGLPAGHFYGASTLSEDGTVLYAMLFDRPRDEIAIKGIRNEIKRVSVVGSGQELSHRKIGGASWAEIPGVLWIEVPEAVLDPNATVIKIELEGALDLYTGAGHAIESN
jgi:alpha-L-fucosidase